MFDYFMRYWAIQVVLALLLLVAYCSSSDAASLRAPESRAEISFTFSPIVKQTAPAVANIYTKRKVVDRISPFFNDPFFNQFFGNQFGSLGGMTRERMVNSLGSGVIVDASGTLITNYHVIKGAQDITVVLNDKREFAAELVVTDEQSDLAVLQVKDKTAQLPYLQLHDSDSLEVGDLVLAIGNPFGVGQTVTSGIISALARSSVKANDFSFFIQTDAAINPGNSGGALVDVEGKLVGIPTAIYSRSGGSNGIGFAIPSNMVRALLAGERRNGKIVKPWLGAQYQNVTKEIAASLRLKKPGGVLVNDVFTGGPADRGGIEVGDVIVAIDDHEIDSIQALRFRTAIVEIGERTRVNIIRDGRRKEVIVRLTTPPDKPDRDERTLEGRHPLKGVTVANLNPALALELQMNAIETGVVITKSPSTRGLKPGDIIQSVNGTNITSTKQLERILKSKEVGWRIVLDRDGRALNLTVVR